MATDVLNKASHWKVVVICNINHTIFQQHYRHASCSSACPWQDPWAHMVLIAPLRESHTANVFFLFPWSCCVISVAIETLLSPFSSLAVVLLSSRDRNSHLGWLCECDFLKPNLPTSLPCKEAGQRKWNQLTPIWQFWPKAGNLNSLCSFCLSSL